MLVSLTQLHWLSCQNQFSPAARLQLCPPHVCKFSILLVSYWFLRFFNDICKSAFLSTLLHASKSWNPEAIQRLQSQQAVPALPMSTSAKKRPLSASPSAHSPSLLPLAQRIRTDIQVAESEIESPEKLRSPPCPENSPSPISPCAKGLPPPAPLIFTPVNTSCLNCEAEMAPYHQCEDTGNVAVPAYLGSLPLCHYCCHLGSGDFPVHYFMQCMCDDKDCSCKCYCSGAQLKHKHHVFPARFLNVEPMDPSEVPKAKVIADERTERTRGYYPNCDSPSCVKYMKEDGLCLKLPSQSMWSDLTFFVLRVFWWSLWFSFLQISIYDAMRNK